jgi:hypothetical protein
MIREASGGKRGPRRGTNSRPENSLLRTALASIMLAIIFVVEWVEVGRVSKLRKV